MDGFKFFFVVAFVIAIIVGVFYVKAQIEVHRDCDGAVVKNTFDWPVCVH